MRIIQRLIKFSNRKEKQKNCPGNSIDILNIHLGVKL